ncbi:alpha/beta hydrolase [Rhizobiaceae bacterium BDR2-2]|uniref:Alpha/beta hydrolase n=1 Tax=Ectorhizobium quercum TaxID=2965071 RepID=A0AAE3MYJ2_9HYPH|nr:alpha/beta hydrolase [Ectorhizobium quercum]MCX8996836.1 alpha/beta hydrolase [Ectorhizobium quercum]
MEATIYALSAEDLAFGGEQSSGFFDGHDGARLRYAFFSPERERPRGTVVILQGRNECIEKYLETIRELTEAGFMVATFDLRGQALSGRLSRNPRAGHVLRFADYVADTERFLTMFVEPVAPQPVHILAHSLGCLIALSLAPRLEGRISRMVLSAPLVGLTGLPVPPAVAFSIASLFSLAGLGERPLGRERDAMLFDGNPLTSCPTRFGHFSTLRGTHRDLGIGPPTARWLNEIRKAMRRVMQPDYLTRITVPTLILAPMRDGVVPYGEMERLARHFRAARLVPIPGARHELLMEKDRYRAQALAAILAFFPETATEAVTG